MNPFRLYKCGLVISLILYSQASFSAQCTDSPPIKELQGPETLWHDDFGKGFAPWGEVKFQFGIENMAFIPDPDGRFPKLLRVRYPKGSFDPASALKGLAPMGGMQFTSRFDSMKVPVSDSILLSYAVRFDEKFDFVRGGKLPGLYGGTPRSGGQIPNGRDGYSTRIVWQSNGRGAVYAYLPTNSMVIKGVTYGTVIGLGSWQFKPGKWTDVSHLVKLNDPGVDNGRITVWIDGALVHDECNLRFRDTLNLRINGIFFSTFFGGNDPSWGSRADTYVDFADFRLFRVKAE